ncbi:MAG: leucine-rich repeat domain-containing protein [Candidatus Poribacteria bacterium]|nr:leucine-rich repeat domain-containing protein [Candidatus Poribacteria bacterium]
MKHLYMLSVILIVFLSCSSVQHVEIPEENLAAAIRKNLGLRSNELIPQSKLGKLETLSAPQKDIKDLTGLEKAKSLTALELYGNQINDISPLAGLTNLTKLTLSGNQISDITPLKGLKRLTYLGLEQNHIHDIKPIENLKNLKFLFLKQNPVNDLSLVQKLTLKKKEEEDTETLPFSADANQYETRTGLPAGAIARFGKGGINVMQFSPDGRKLAVGTDIGVWLYDSAIGKSRYLHGKTTRQSNAVAFSPDGRILASGGSSNPDIQLWNMETGEELLRIALPISTNLHLMNKKDVTYEKSVAALAFSKDGSTLLSLSHSGIFNYWDVYTGKKLSEYRSNFDSEGVLALSENGRNFACGYWNGKIWSGDASTGERTATLKGHAANSFRKILKNADKYRRIRALAFSPDGKFLASGSEDKKVQVWHTSGSTRNATLKGHTGWITALTFSKDGKILASGDTDSTVRLWDVYKKRSLATLKGHTNGILAMAFTQDGSTLATGSADGTIRFWDVKSQNVLSTFATGHTEWVRTVAFSTDSTTLSFAMFNGTGDVWNIKTAKQLDVFKTYPQELTYAVTLSPDATRLACHNINGTISFNSLGWKTIIEYHGNDRMRLWNLETGEELPSLNEVYGVMAFSPDSKTLASKSSHDIVKWSTTTDSEVGMHFGLTVGRNKEILLSEVRTSAELLRIHLGKRGGPLSGGGLNPSTPLVFSPDATMLAAGQKLWDMDSWQQIAEFPSKSDMVVAFTTDNTMLATQDSRSAEKEIRLWDITTPTNPQKLNTLYLPNSLDNRVLTFSPNGTILVESTKVSLNTYCEATISLWDVKTGKKLLSLPGHTEPIETLLFSHDGKILASGSQDGTVLLWDWEKVLRDVMLENRWPNER